MHRCLQTLRCKVFDLLGKLFSNQKDSGSNPGSANLLVSVSLCKMPITTRALDASISVCEHVKCVWMGEWDLQ